VISINGEPPVSAQPRDTLDRSVATATPDSSAGVAQEGDIFSAIERLGGLHEKGVLTDEEFAQKKVELLDRL
jgi:hypothetical protein